MCGSWSASDKWPPCINLKAMGQSANVEDETPALLLEFGVDHGDIGPEILREVESTVKSDRFQEDGCLGWKPTPEMYEGRREYRKERIFTINTTTANDSDDALHVINNCQMAGLRLESILLMYSILLLRARMLTKKLQGELP